MLPELAPTKKESGKRVTKVFTKYEISEAQCHLLYGECLHLIFPQLYFHYLFGNRNVPLQKLWVIMKNFDGEGGEASKST